MATYEELVHQEMRDRVKELCNASGGRKKLAEQMAISYDFIADICDGVYFPSVDVFELRFGPLTTKKPVEVSAKKSEVTDLSKLDIPVTIRCPEFDKLTALMYKVGYDVRIVLDR
jgi:hypothetical protein